MSGRPRARTLQRQLIHPTLPNFSRISSSDAHAHAHSLPESYAWLFRCFYYFIPGRLRYSKLNAFNSQRTSTWSGWWDKMPVFSWPILRNLCSCKVGSSLMRSDGAVASGVGLYALTYLSDVHPPPRPPEPISQLSRPRLLRATSSPVPRKPSYGTATELRSSIGTPCTAVDVSRVLHERVASTAPLPLIIVFSADW